ncbi:hypothetical protein [Goodfellowiella coeruleoviolacea]|uniref:ATP-grasp target RiPP n=1 Tax=Goodfellowiella coeruleoviolacea TaxID=334858 RepID=A0AAE3GJ26_9PSEU|nr:hypothetical protein [Goodfellowiella coeruleoviolacea]MCP2167053.1 putative ATP-grasp target RiPP [Goodfellowiella coeruleoviolacea]
MPITTETRLLAGELSSAEQRFPLPRPALTVPLATDASTEGIRPFGMRFFQPTGAAQAPELPAHRYSTTRQVSVDSTTGEPMVRTLNAWDRTTTGGADGNGPNVEEHKMDFCA